MNSIALSIFKTDIKFITFFKLRKEDFNDDAGKQNPPSNPYDNGELTRGAVAMIIPFLSYFEISYVIAEPKFALSKYGIG